jgi:tyrosyl-tRNA synthetase
MSKSLGNYVGISEPPQEMFGKLMSIPDDLMWDYYELATDRSESEIVQLKNDVASGKLHPMDAKMKLAEEIVSTFHGTDAGRKAADHFQRVFRDRKAPAEAPVHKVPRGPAKKLTTLLVELNVAPSKSEAERLIKQKGVEIDGSTVEDFRKEIDFARPGAFLLRAGKKKFVQIVVE